MEASRLADAVALTSTDKEALCGGLRAAFAARTTSRRKRAPRGEGLSNAERDRGDRARVYQAYDALFDALTAVPGVLDQAASFELPKKPSKGYNNFNCARLLAAAADAISHLAARLLFIGSAAHGPSDAASAGVVAETARGDAVVATPTRVVDELSDSLRSVSIGRSAAGDDMFKFWRGLGCDEKTARQKLREDARLLHFEGPRKQSSTALATVRLKLRGRARICFDMTTGARVYPLKNVPEAVKRLRRAWSPTPPEWERLPDAVTAAFNLDASRYVARRKGSALDVSEMVRLGARFGPSVRATLKPLSNPPWRCLTRNCPSVVARRVGRRARASRSAPRGSVVALGADELAAGAPFLRHAGGRAAAASFASLARASSSAPRMKIDVIEHILRFVGADPGPLDFVLASNDDARHARGLAAAAASFVAAPSNEAAGESSDDEVVSLPDGGVAAMPCLARGTRSRPRAPPRSDSTPEVATEPEPAAEPESEPEPVSWAQCVLCDKWRVVDADTAALAALSPSWTCADGGVTCSKMACSAEDPNCECHQRDWDRNVLLVSPARCVLARYCSPRGAGAAHGMSKQTVERCCHVSASETENVFRYANGFNAATCRGQKRRRVQLQRPPADSETADAATRRVHLQRPPADSETADAATRRGQLRLRVHRQRSPVDSETANAATRNWRNVFLKISRDAPPVPFQMPPPPSPIVPSEAAPP